MLRFVARNFLLFSTVPQNSRLVRATSVQQIADFVAPSYGQGQELSLALNDPRRVSSASMTYTLKALSCRIAADGSDEAAKTAARRIEHWISAGLFGLAGVDIGPKALGRGRVRRYPEEALPWLLIWSALADRGLGVVAMSITTSSIRLKLLNKGQEGKWLRQAMRGEGPALFLINESIATDQVSLDRSSGIAKWKLGRSPIKLTDDWSGGFLLNLTMIFKRAAKT